MAFRLIDIENWERKEFYEHFINQVVCTYSVVVKSFVHFSLMNTEPLTCMILPQTLERMRFTTS